MINPTDYPHYPAAPGEDDVDTALAWVSAVTSDPGASTEELLAAADMLAAASMRYAEQVAHDADVAMARITLGAPVRPRPHLRIVR